MNNAEFQLRGVGDPRLAVHATSALPAWLWSIDGTRILWANPVGARLFGATNGAELAARIFGPADAQRRQEAQLAGGLPSTGAIRLGRLGGVGAAPAHLTPGPRGAPGRTVAPPGRRHRHADRRVHPRRDVRRRQRRRAIAARFSQSLRGR